MDMQWIPGGEFMMGSERFYPEEAPCHKVRVDGFFMDIQPVTNRQFGDFVRATGYTTLAEEAPRAEDYPGAPPEMLKPGSLVFQTPQSPVSLNDWSNWWAFVFGANWRQPFGPGSSLEGMEEHPVVHIAYQDAQAYAHWAGKELPTEAEWEFAARGGLEGREFAWGDELNPDGKQLANTWQGDFPANNLKLDGYEFSSPVRAFPANGFGLFDMIGNVWEWTSDYWTERRPSQQVKTCCVPRNPRITSEEDSYDPCMPDIKIPRKVLKGGSYLCAPNYCQRYRPAARHPEAIDTSTCHVGFRCVKRIDP